MLYVRVALEACAAAALAAVVYHYVGYPLVLRVAAALGRAPAEPAPLAVLPTLSVIIPCYNEAASLPAKLEALRAADYPADKVEIVVVSDGSSDETEAVARAAEGVRVVGWPERRGKPAALNAGVAEATGEILVFTDANAMAAPASLRELVAPFADPRVGGVCGEQLITRGASSERAYWRWEAGIKRLEAAVGSVVGADGSLYAVKRILYKRIPEGRVIMDDFFVSLQAVAAGYRLAYAPEAVAYEDALEDGGAEFKRKARIMAGSLVALAALDTAIWRRLPWQLFSHKILRWLGPAFLAATLVASAAAAAVGSVFGAVLLGAQVAFYAAAAVGWLMRRRRPSLVFRAPYSFASANVALACGWWQYFFGGKIPAWEKLR
jgi:cellulose synthase/poly-beta-1,6-N-acetylglucosamine synthase-like glycosyltransferase